jgi:2-hydroxy-4-carboxymuconate semialdehyde hemiacetal dehydrogenase
MKICMLGTGRMAVNHSRALASLPDVELHAVINPRQEYAEAFRQEHGYQRASASLDDALADDGFDAVVVTTPNALHAVQSAAALRAGKHVLCEIPLALSLADTEALGRLAKERDLRLMVCHTERYEAGRIELRRRVADGELHPLHVVARFHMLRRGELKTEQAHHGWVDSALWHHGCHTVDGVMDILGPHRPRDLCAHFGPAWRTLGVPLDVTLQWRALSPITGDDVLVQVSLSHNAHWGQHDYHVIALEDTLLADQASLRNRDGTIIDEREYSGHVLAQDTEFVDAVREGRAPAVDVETVLPTMRVLQAAWEVWLADQGGTSTGL